MTPLCSHTNGIKQRYPTCWLCQYSRFMIDLRSNTLIIHLRCSLRFRSWKDISLGWWNALASAWFPDVRHFENLTPWIQLRLRLFHVPCREHRTVRGLWKKQGIPCFFNRKRKCLLFTSRWRRSSRWRRRVFPVFIWIRNNVGWRVTSTNQNVC